MNKLPSTLTKNQAIAFAVVAFNNFINSGNTSCFDISTIETFYTGAMEAHNDLKEKKKKKMKINIEEI